MPELGQYGSVRGAPSNGCLYRDWVTRHFTHYFPVDFIHEKYIILKQDDGLILRLCGECINSSRTIIFCAKNSNFCEYEMNDSLKRREKLQQLEKLNDALMEEYKRWNAEADEAMRSYSNTRGGSAMEQMFMSKHNSARDRAKSAYDRACEVRHQMGEV